MMYAMRPMCGGTSSSPTQMRRISVKSISKYSAKPAQTPATFLWASTRRSLRGGAAEGDETGSGPLDVDLPQEMQKRAEASSRVPHEVQNISGLSLSERLRRSFCANVYVQAGRRRSKLISGGAPRRTGTPIVPMPAVT